MQSFLEALRLAARAIWAYKLRTSLTTLGITVGIFAITLTFTLVDTLQYSVSRNLSKLGNTVLYVHKWPWKDNSEDWHKYIQRPRMKYKDFQALEQDLNHIEAVSFEAKAGNQLVKWNGREVSQVAVRGVTLGDIKIQGYELSNGRYFMPIEMRSGRKVVILGAAVAQLLYGNANPVGRKLELKGQRLTVIGVLEKQGSNIFGQSADEGIVVPYHFMTQIFDVNRGRRNGGDVGSRVVAVKTINREKLPQVEDEIIGLMRRSRGLRPGVENNFSINKQETLMDSLGQLFDVLEVGGFFISVFALLVGGFGISNIMFVAVKERTKEIGMQKALGATRWFVLSQFLIEAILLCLVGAAVGIVLVFGIAALAQSILNALDAGVTVQITGRTILTGVILAVVTGILSGILPAVGASRLDPVIAIRTG